MKSTMNEIDYIFKFGVIKGSHEFYVKQFSVEKEEDIYYSCTTENGKDVAIEKAELNSLIATDKDYYILIKAEGRFDASNIAIKTLIEFAAGYE